MITFFSYRISLSEIDRSRQKFLVAALSDDHNLNVFKKLLSLPPMWRKLGYFLPFVILVWPTSPPSAYSGTMMIGKKTRQRWERIISFSTHRLLFLLWKRKRSNVEDHYLDNQILLQGFSSIRTMTQKSFLLKYKISLLNILQWATCFVLAIQTLHTDELEM